MHEVEVAVNKASIKRILLPSALAIGSINSSEPHKISMAKVNATIWLPFKLRLSSFNHLCNKLIKNNKFFTILTKAAKYYLLNINQVYSHYFMLVNFTCLLKDRFI